LIVVIKLIYGDDVWLKLLKNNVWLKLLKNKIKQFGRLTSFESHCYTVVAVAVLDPPPICSKERKEKELRKC
jgi:hypothetical protein